ncbi:MAG: protein kinase [Myxococcota bacterium]|nr:protein kinase [Myxococcota bacterium]
MELPARFGKYELIRRLAKGGMAEIFLARSFGVEGFERHLVIKRILPDLASSAKFVGLFIKEAKISASLSHPNIVQIYELGRVSSDHYIAMEHIHGRDLTRLNKSLRGQEERMPIPLAVFVVASILRGLHHAHTRTDAQGRTLNLIHRDVSPHNVMIGFQGDVKLFDFGIARLVGDSEPVEGMPGGGKYAYMSPEQAAGRPMDHRSDVYSAGVVLYELLVGHRLFDDPDPAEKLRKVRAAEVPDPRLENPNVSDELWSIVASMLAKDPDSRPATAGDAEERLWAYLYRSNLRADAHELAVYMQERFPDEAQGNPGVADLEGLASDLRRLEGGGTNLTDISAVDANTVTSSQDNVKIPRLLRGSKGERKVVAVLMAEVIGFTDMSARADAAEVVRWHYKLLRRLRRVVDRHGGVLESYEDDRFLVFFGVPKAGEHDLERAVACADAIQMLTQQGSIRRRRIAISIGVHRGEITMGGKSGRSMRYLARGDTIKMAHRLCSEADLGQVLVSDRVAAMAGHRFRFTSGPKFRRKGRRTEYKSFSLQGVRDRLDPVTGRWVSRGDEMEQISEAIGRLASGRGAVVSIIGGAGMGKSRLLREVQRLARVRGVPFVFSRARPYRGYRPFDVLRDVAAHVLGVSRDDGPEVVQSQLHRLTSLGVSDEDLVVIGAMYGVRKRSDARADVDKMIGAASRLVDAIARSGPAIIAVDDVQYLGSLERQIVGAAIRGHQRHPVVFLFAGRDGLPSELRPTDFRIALGRIKGGRFDEMVGELLGSKSVEAPLMDVLRSTSEGNPLYIDELIRSLKQAGRIELDGARAGLVGSPGEVQLPVNLEGMISSRIDALGPASKGVLQIAATIGMSFPVALVREASGLDDIGALLEELIERGIVERSGPEVGGVAHFSSVLLWESVHRSILGVRLSEFHRMIADAMERLYGDMLDDKRMDLAAHCAAGGQFLRAAGHAERGGDHLRSQQIIHPALACWEEGIGWLDRVSRPGHAARVKEAMLRLKAGEGWRLAGDPRKSEIHLQVAQDLGEDTGDPEIEARSTVSLGHLYSYMGRPVLSGASFDQARALAIGSFNTRELAEAAPWRREVAVDALNGLGALALENGNTEHGDALLERAREIAGTDDLLAARALNTLALRTIRNGDNTASLALLEEAKKRAERAKDPLLLGRILNNLGTLHTEAEQYDDALDLYQTALRIREGLDYRLGAVINLHNIGDVHFRLGDDARAWASFKKSRDIASASGYAPGVVMNDAFMAYLEGKKGEADIDQRLVAITAKADKTAHNETRVNARFLLGKHRQEGGDTVGAREVWEEGIALAAALEAPQLARELKASLAALG